MKRLVIFGLLMLMVISAETVAAGGVGISPAYYREFFEPGLVRSFQFHSFNSDSSKDVNLYVKGDLAQYVNLSESSLTGTGVFTATVHLPDKIDIPGTHKIFIGVMEAKETPEGSAIGGIAAIQGRIDIIVPYPGKYSESTFFINNINEGEEAGYGLEIQNLGLEDLFIKPTIEVYNNDMTKKIITEEIEQVRLKSKNVLNITGTLDTQNLTAGEYQTLAIINWDNETNKINKILRIGEFLVEINDYDYLFEQDKINRFNIGIQNKWNTKIDKVSASVVITDEGKVVGNFKTISVETNPWEIKNITGYFDTTGLEAKRYVASIVLSYGGETSSKLVAIYVNESPTKTYLRYIISTAIAVILIIIAFIYLILKIRKLRRKGVLKKTRKHFLKK